MAEKRNDVRENNFEFGYVTLSPASAILEVLFAKPNLS